MSESIRIEGYAIVSANGMIADSECLMPNSLKFEADQEFLDNSLDRAALLVHGRKSHECQNKSALRRRLLLTRCVKTFEPDPTSPNVWLWNPAGVTLAEVCEKLAVTRGSIAVIGGTAAYDMFLDSYAEFHLCRAGKVEIPDGTPVLSEVGRGRSTDEVLRDAGLVPKYKRLLDPDHALTHECWIR